MAEYWVTKDVQEFYLINATDQKHAENIANKHLNTLYKIVDSEVKDIRVEKKSTRVQVDFINRKNREDMKKTNIIYSTLLSYRSYKSVGNEENIEQVIKDMHKDLLLLAEEYAVNLEEEQKGKQWKMN